MAIKRNKAENVRRLNLSRARNNGSSDPFNFHGETFYFLFFVRRVSVGFC